MEDYELKSTKPTKTSEEDTTETTHTNDLNVKNLKDELKTSQDEIRNLELKLNQLLKEREELNKKLYPISSNSNSLSSYSTIQSIQTQTQTYNNNQTINSNSFYTPWKTPSTQ